MLYVLVSKGMVGLSYSTITVGFKLAERMVMNARNKMLKILNNRL